MHIGHPGERGSVPGNACRSRRRWVLAGASIGLGAFLGVPVRAGDYPDKAIRLVVPFPAGGATDLMARALGQRLGESLGKPVIIDNRAGAGGGIGAEAVAGAAPDGYTLLFATMGSLTINSSLYRNLRYDPFKSFEPITLTHNTSNLLVVHPAVPATTVAELIALARRSPGSLTFASSGNGTTSHLSGELFKSLAKVDLTHVPYKGSAPAMADFLGGRISMMFDTTSNFVEHVKSGRLRALGSTGRRRSPAMPNVPTISETPGMGDYEMSLWLGVLAPAGTAKTITQRLNREIALVMSAPDMVRQMADAGIEVRLGSAQEFSALIRSDTAKWAAVVKRAGIRID
ncbi:Bug family tripartite tricarboxylate transporter substrate binding protein [Variovorax paradoxus]|uniref:Bug family tripartite tricarboxylate transporter substrate binding protein n=1 Tax=Variovorax paradoxus TaxID=34073 RepID=UPI0027854115|nr:tripartite tricarboxylate transporter substrate binding protein [Variovorax paradoxus]MDQ0586166.1 tripartite-type tricarboxylate transporter receptor subunit TctC [Variovorax paradoxus]